MLFFTFLILYLSPKDCLPYASCCLSFFLFFFICIDSISCHSRNPALYFQTRHLAVDLHDGNYSPTPSHLIAVKKESAFRVLSGLHHPSTSFQPLPVSLCSRPKLAWWFSFFNVALLLMLFVPHYKALRVL